MIYIILTVSVVIVFYLIRKQDTDEIKNDINKFSRRNDDEF